MLKITNARVFVGGEFIDREIGIEGGMVAHIGNVGESDETLDAKGQWLLPGLIDPHVHLREPGATHKEDFASGSRAAIAGGFTGVIDMPNSDPPTTTVQALHEKKDLAKKSKCEVFFHFGAGENNFVEIKKANPSSLKIYMGETTGKMYLDGRTVETHFERFPKEKPVVIHAEGNNIKKAIELAKKHNHRIHLAHAPSAAAVRDAKTWEKATVEVAPHHLFLSDAFNPKLAAVKPPLQTESERQELWSVLNDITCIASDHAPHTLEEKEKGAYGFPGLETTFALMLKAYYERHIPFPWLMQRLAENPARIFSLGKRGKIEKGYMANLILVDPKKEWTVKGEELQTKCQWSPYEGWKLKGKTILAIVQGKIVYQENEFV
ncbi:MAG TPA: dihydroorotase family protein [Candidatus Bilamarchaeaceae archaeon]|nr:dihydroorotase family protein [Candidatus Bilamarchaeaceae archaeon]